MRPIHGPPVVALALFATFLAVTIAQAKPGDLDPSFGGDGKVVNRFCTHPRDGQVVIDQHGRMVFAGGDSGRTQFCVARYRRDGRFDRSFSGDGRVTTDFAAPAAARAVTVDSGGRIVAAGGYGSSCCGLNSFALARYRPNGALDSSFGVGGKVITSFRAAAKANAVAIDSHSRIVLAGNSFGDFALARYKRNGTLDSSFGAGGKVTTNFKGAHGATSAAIDARDRIVAAGDSAGDFTLARYTPNGSLDSAFGAGGVVTTRFEGGDFARSVRIDARGRIVAAGTSGPHFALARYWRNGSLDSSLSRNGKVTTAFEDRAGASSMAIDSRGRIVAAGGAFEIARYRPNGHLDRSFSRNGKVTTGFGAFANSVAIDFRDRIVALGWHSHLVLARFIGYRWR